MTDFMKQHRDTEQKVHEQLYNNLFLLSNFYPTTKEFNVIFKRDMFVKNNKTAFFEVVHYLLIILEPELTKQKLTTWPPYEIKREIKFRNEVLQYINILNSMYDNADIPVLVQSHLISPGGLRITKFLLKLSQLVIYEHLKKLGNLDMLMCPKPSKNVNLKKSYVNSLKEKTVSIENTTREMMEDFKNFHLNLNEKAIFTVEELTKFNDSIKEAKKVHEEVKEEFDKRYPSYPSLESIKEKLTILKTELKEVDNINRVISDCVVLLSHLNSTDFTLEHKDLEIPSEIQHILKNDCELEIIEFFHGLKILLERKAMELPNPSEFFIRENLEKVGELDEKYQVLLKRHMETQNGIQKNIEEILSRVKVVEEEILAMPLEEY